MASSKSTETASSLSDPSTLELFQRNWTLYRKMVDNNFLFHREVYARLRVFLLEEVGRPFRFVDIACGDAGGSAGALRGTQVRAYRGIDFSRHALALAAGALEGLGCPVALEEADYIDIMGLQPGSADVVWMGLSLHHLRAPEKASFMRNVRRDLSDGGCFVTYENTSPDGEDRENWLCRWELQRSFWTAYSDEEFDAMFDHVRAADYPETESGWRAIGRDSGFANVRELYAAPTDMFRMYCFTT